MAQTGVALSVGIPFTAGWKCLCQYAIPKPSRTKLPQRITEARRAILDRAVEIERMNQPRSEESGRFAVPHGRSPCVKSIAVFFLSEVSSL